MATTRQYLVPGWGYLNEVKGNQYLIPGQGYINETISTGAISDISWFPVYPPSASNSPIQSPAGQAFGFVTPYIAPPILPMPIYADQNRPNLRRQADFTFSAPKSIAAISYPQHPIYNDQARPNLRLQADYIFEPIQKLNFKQPWLPRYDNQVPVYKQTVTGGMVEPILPIQKLLPWLPNYPNQWPFFNQQLPYGAVEPIQHLNFKLSWLPRYPDVAPPVINANIRMADKIFTSASIILLPWLPALPDLYRESPRVKGGSYFSPSEPVKFKLSWLPQYPDLHREPPRVKGDSFFAPITLFFKLSWLPDYADQQRLNLRGQADFSFEPPYAIIKPPPYGWFPSYPDSIPGNPTSPSLLAGFFGIPFTYKSFVTPTGRIINPPSQARLLNPEEQSRILDPSSQSRIL